MHETQWRRVEELYHLTLEHSPGERAAFLDNECAGDVGLKREVETLLESANTVPEFLLCPDRQPDLRPGTMLGPYRLAGWVGSGGMGDVWKARDTRLNRDVAIKVAKAEFTARFEREARAVAALNHPHICQIYDVGSNYLVMELVDGHPLKGPLPLGKAVPLAIQLADALDAAHQKSVVHRDLKPANVIETRSGVKVLDFGLARLQPAEPSIAEDESVLDAPATQEGIILGTPHYMAPEQIEGKPADARTDIFAFGCVFYEMLTGKRAFSGDNTAAILAAILERHSPSIAEIAPALDSVLKKCLAKDPQHRWQNAGDLKAAIIIAAESQPAAPSTRRQWIGATAIGAAGLLGGSTFAWLRRPSRPADTLRVEIDPPAGARLLTQAFGCNFALSPDGRNVVYTAWQGRKTAVWVRPLNGAPPRMISETGPTNFTHPFWSPDSQSFAFNSGLKIMRADAAGETVWTVCDVPQPNVFRGGAWTFDGHIVYALAEDGLFRVSASGGTSVRLTTPDRSVGERGHTRPQLLPRGRFLYLAAGDLPANSAIYAAPLARPSERVRLTSTPSEALYAPGGDGKDYVIWQRDGTLVAQEFDTASLMLRGEAHLIASPVATTSRQETMATVSSNGLLLYSAVNGLSSQLTWVDREGRSAGVLGEAGEYFTFRISPDGRRIAAGRTRLDGDNELWIVESPRGTPVRVGNIANPSLCIWSPDGRAVVYTDVRTHTLVRQDLSGTDEVRQLTQTSPYLQMPSDWSMDGRFILYMEWTPGESLNLMVMEIGPDGGVAGIRPWLATPFTETDAVFIPRAPARWVAYTSIESGRLETYIDSFPERKRKIRISTDGGRFPRWGSGGRELFFMSQDYKLMVVDVNATSDSISASAPRELFPLRIVENAFPPYDVTRDGQHFLVRAATPTPDPLTLITNWPALLAKQR
ncbi:MAG: protein kinase domain-containing protein [Bryobacteraceae bacterium]